MEPQALALFARSVMRVHSDPTSPSAAMRVVKRQLPVFTSAHPAKMTIGSTQRPSSAKSNRRTLLRFIRSSRFKPAITIKSPTLLLYPSITTLIVSKQTADTTLNLQTPMLLALTAFTVCTQGGPKLTRSSPVLRAPMV